MRRGKRRNGGESVREKGSVSEEMKRVKGRGGERRRENKRKEGDDKRDEIKEGEERNGKI